ncbi:nitrite reductase small subunit NirD [Sulfurirhabdus autotrophica]|uniref:Nitrite reductase (NADH) small subunit n=1 Tax=Sulfurirhabdus autotrophica TaxID=1706046 RepID=A0A4R3XSU6_9PROT|nr:nitrite reductase small subunit NirD [Sulfurirhabdus autotrophica]TCV81053.1 nitrite reductase (NADH) small subunit [Sulfurirhabdus autotrophica]
MATWMKVVPLNEVPKLGARVVTHGGVDIAIFRTDGDDVFAVNNKCPHKGGPLSQGIVSGNKVTCPLHGMNICLNDGKVMEPDEGCVATYPTKVEDGVVFMEV